MIHDETDVRLVQRQRGSGGHRPQPQPQPQPEPQPTPQTFMGMGQDELAAFLSHGQGAHAAPPQVWLPQPPQQLWPAQCMPPSMQPLQHVPLAPP